MIKNMKFEINDVDMKDLYHYKDKLRFSAKEDLAIN